MMYKKIIILFLISISTFANEGCFEALKEFKATYGLNSWDKIDTNNIQRYEFIKIAIRIEDKFNKPITEIQERELESFLKEISSPIQSKKSLLDHKNKLFKDEQDFILSLAPQGLSEEKIYILFEAHKELGAINFTTSNISLRHFDYYEKLASTYLFIDIEAKEIKKYLNLKFTPGIKTLKEFLHFQSDIELTEDYAVQILKELNSQGIDVSSQKNIKKIDERFQRATIKHIRKSMSPSSFISLLSKEGIKYEDLIKKVLTTEQKGHYQKIKNREFTIDDYVKVLNKLKEEGIDISSRTSISKANYFMEEVTQEVFNKRHSPSTFFAYLAEKDFTLEDILKHGNFQDELIKFNQRSKNVINDENAIIYLKAIKEIAPNKSINQIIEENDKSVFKALSIKLFGKAFSPISLRSHIQSQKGKKLEYFYKEAGLEDELALLKRRDVIAKLAINNIEEILIQLDKAGANLAVQREFFKQTEIALKISREVIGHELSPKMINHYRKIKAPSLPILLKRLGLKNQLKQYKQAYSSLSNVEVKSLFNELKSRGKNYQNIFDFLKDNNSIKEIQSELFGIELNSFDILTKIIKTTGNFNKLLKIDSDEDVYILSLIVKELHDNNFDISKSSNFKANTSEVSNILSRLHGIQLSGEELYKKIFNSQKSYKVILEKVNLEDQLPTYISKFSDLIAKDLRESGYPKSFNTSGNYDKASEIASKYYDEKFEKQDLLNILKKEFGEDYKLFKMKHRYFEVEPIFHNFIKNRKWKFEEHTPAQNFTFLKESLKEFYGTTPSLMRVIHFAHKMDFLNHNDFEFPDKYLSLYEHIEASKYSNDSAAKQVLRDFKDESNFHVADESTPESLLIDQEDLVERIAYEFDLYEVSNSRAILLVMIEEGILTRPHLLERFPNDSESVDYILKIIMDNREAILEILI